jgi:hypothetical protein
VVEGDTIIVNDWLTVAMQSMVTAMWSMVDGKRTEAVVLRFADGGGGGRVRMEATSLLWKDYLDAHPSAGAYILQERCVYNAA